MPKLEEYELAASRSQLALAALPHDRQVLQGKEPGVRVRGE
ncbi:hypothetical protein [Chroococcidiopsis cubana]|nr:hypothetical protein [Chroococcidiopsis cubana]